MPVVTGTLWDVGLGHLAGQQPELLFTLNQPQRTADSVYATRAVSVVPASSGDFSATLADTLAMADDAWYSLKVRWQEPGPSGAPGWVNCDLPDWQIRVPSGGGPIGGTVQKPPTNQRFVYVSLWAPENPLPFMLWLKQDPNDPNNPAGPSDLFEWRNV